MALCNEKRFDEAEEYIEQAIKLDPIRSRNYEGFLPIFYMGASNSQKAMFWANIIFERTSHSRHDGSRAAISVHLGDFQAANSFLQKFKLARPEIKPLMMISKKYHC